MGIQNRRTVVKGAAWAAPAIVSSAIIPAYAASLKPALDGWLNNKTSCYTGQENMLYSFDGRGTYPTRGIWVSGSNSTAKITNVKITQYISTAAGKLTFRVGATSQWSLLTFDANAPAKSGYYAYTTTFSGTWKFDTSNKIWFPSTLPFFQASSGTCVRSLQVITARQASVDGVVYTTERSGTLRPV